MELIPQLYLIGGFYIFTHHISGAYDGLIEPLIKGIIYRKDKRGTPKNRLSIPLINCYYCLTWWTCIIYLLIIKDISWNALFNAMLATISTNPMARIYDIIKHASTAIYNKIIILLTKDIK